MPVDAASFQWMEVPHRELEALFQQHQEALLARDLVLAEELLGRFNRRLVLHATQENEYLLPLYRRLKLPAGEGADIFEDEHNRILEQMEALIERVHNACRRPPPDDLPRLLIEILDRESTLKHLLEHHYIREQDTLFPRLDAGVSKSVRLDALRRCQSEWKE